MRLFGQKILKRDPNLIELFKSGGHTFYTWKHFDHMPAFREMFVRYHYAKMSRGINNADLISFCQTILKFNNDRKRDDITALVKFFEQHISEYANEKIEEEKHMKFIESLSELQYKDYIGKDYVGNLLKISKKNLQK
jgi:hypothetical protein